MLPEASSLALSTAIQQAGADSAACSLPSVAYWSGALKALLQRHNTGEILAIYSLSTARMRRPSNASPPTQRPGATRQTPAVVSAL